MIYYHFTNAFCTQVKGEPNIKGILTDFFEKNELKETIKGIGKVNSFTKSIYVFRNKTPFFEAIIEEKQVEDKNHERITVYFIRALKNIKNSLQDYVDIRDGKWIDKNPFDEKDLSDFLNEYSNVPESEQKLEQIPHEFISWQDDYKLKVNYDIYEHYNWVNYSISNSPKEGLRLQDSKIFQNIFKIINKESLGDILSEKGNKKFFRYYDDEFKIVVFYVDVFVNNKFLKIIFGGGNEEVQSDYLDRMGSEFERLFEYDFDDLLQVSQICLKAYPGWVLKDEELWMKIQKNSEFGNLSLLPEQTDFLESFRFPKYINGQAGSGKSTILYYLFSNIYYYKCAGEIKGDIIFLTENEKLLTHTIDSIYDLINNNPEFQLSQNDADLINLKMNFNSFREFLKSFLLNKDEFKDELYLDFSKFKKLYDDSAISITTKRKYSAELIWFVVTTYVYGYDKDNMITYSNYDLLMPREGKDIIAKDDLKVIENEIIYPFYNKLINENGYWNKVKLIKYLESKNLVNKSYEVIFCDEAQDFSKVELEFINSISLYKKYNLENVKQYPIVFAGDALQTVNPTGFKSEVLTSMIYTSLTDPKVGFKLDQTDLIFTPKYNYRSSQTIVNLANAIQNWRKNELSETITDLQKSKRNSAYLNQNIVVFVDVNEFNESLEIKEKVEFKTIIVPVNNNEIDDYKRRYPILEKYENIITPIDAKGLDFSEVVIFGFGDYFLNNVNGHYENKFFFNKLYVSITRSREELVIIDSQQSKVDFWDRIIDRYIVDSQSGFESISDFVVSNSTSIIQSKETIVEQDAIQQKDIGEINKNIPLLRIASNHFLKIGNLAEYYFCLGIIEEINCKYRDASSYFFNKELVNNESAKRRGIFALWNANEYQQILNYKQLNDKFKKVIDIICIAILEKESVFDETDVDFLDDNLKHLFELKRLSSNNDLLKTMFLDNLKYSDSDNVLTRVFDLIVALFKDDLSKEDLDEVDLLLYNKKQFNLVISLFSNFNIESIYYYLSKAELAKRRRKQEEYITNLGKILYGGFAKNKGFETTIGKEDIAHMILTYHRDNDLEFSINKSDPYYNIYIILSQLYLNELVSNDLLQEVSSSFIKEERLVELLSFYYYILQNDNFTHLIYNDILFEWKELYLKIYNNIDSLNEEYKLLCELKEFPYTPFSLEESRISNHHILKIRTNYFKQFNELEISDIGQFNLIVGDNNIGKTTALEMFLITEEEDLTYDRLLHSYIERAKLIPDRVINSDKDDYEFIVNSAFLSNFQTYNIDALPFFSIYRGKTVQKICLGLNGTENFPLGYNTYHFLKQKKVQKNLDFNKTLDSPLYSFGKGYGSDLGRAFDIFIKKSRLEEHFKSNISLFIPNVEEIYLNSEGEIRIRTVDENIDRPLFSFGDGANKLFRILMLLSIHKGKMVLIDEIDSGIHFSRFQRFWEIILKVALKDNTQIITTTHNIECLHYLVEALKENKEALEKTRVIKLIKTNRLKSVTYDFENFNLAIEDNIEIRG